MSGSSYKDIVVTIKDRIVSSGTYRINTDIFQFNRPQFLNSFGGNLLAESIQAIRELNEHPDTVFTVLTGEGRYFCSGADVRSWELSETEKNGTVAQRKLAFLNRFIEGKLSE
ncbi:peroxisomal d3d2-enoyl- isomerase protein [Rutstroemia sp. NJR-2017a BBW]|nr:peroxisomal d3d2-enoyl- isomerase protein [Rutstroemia sp. NJR-2017a BBW]